MRTIATFIVIAALAAAACSPGVGATTTTLEGGVAGASDLPQSEGADTGTAPETSMPDSEEEHVPAPAFPEGLDWINTAAPLTLDELQGKVVLLDFWTYGCINCIHIIDDLEKLEAEYPDELVVIGVHSAKFTNESATENIKEVVQRYDLAHPVVNDAQFEIWNAWGARAWPTVGLIDPAGNVVGTHAGEGVYDVVAPFVARLVTEFDAEGRLDREPLALSLEKDRAPTTVLSFPGKVLADPDTPRLFVADTGHNRVVEVDEAGEVTAVYGSGRSGFADGAASTARFAAPQGMALSSDGATLYVADTNNHAVRQIDLASGQVETLAGNGTMGWPPTAGTAADVELNSPWGLARRDSSLYVANAGTHQIWTIDLAGGDAGPLVGSAREGTDNGPIADAALAQPSGLAFGDDGVLYFADSESSSIRSAAVLEPDGEAALVAGGRANLFEFGDEDGTGDQARFQHPLGIAWHEGRLLVADTYNSKIKAIAPATGEATTLLGGDQGWADGDDPRFYEPGGISVKEDLLYVADTNNHSIRVVNLETGTASTLVVSGIEQFAVPSAPEFDAEAVRAPEAGVSAGPASILLDVILPPSYKVNEDASSSIVWSAEGEVASFPGDGTVDLTGTSFPVEMPVELHEGSGTLIGDLTLVWCREDAEGLCFFEQRRLEAPVDVGPAGPSAVIDIGFGLDAPEA